MNRPNSCAFVFAALLWALLPPAVAIDSVITYQGRLSDAGQAANGAYDLRFTLQDEAGQAIGAPVTLEDVEVAGGLFTVTLDFGFAPFDGEDRWIEIAVRRDDAPFTTLAPRTRLTATPYALHAAQAGLAQAAETASVAVDATQLGGFAPSAYVRDDDARLVDPRAPLPGSAAYIQNQDALAQAGGFHITGTGAAGILSAALQYNLGAERILSFTNASVHLGPGTAQANTSGNQNVFVGHQAGLSNTSGAFNSFVGLWAGRDNTTGLGNNFYGSETGRSTTTGCCNAFFGGSAGFANLTGSFNTFVGERSAQGMASGDYNSTLGAFATIAANGLVNATAIGGRASVAQSNSLVLGAIAGVNGAAADTRVGIGTTTPRAKLEVGGDLLVGAPGAGLILVSPNGAECVRLSIDDTPNFIGVPVPCP